VNIFIILESKTTFIAQPQQLKNSTEKVAGSGNSKIKNFITVKLNYEQN
jgi:hypothetical protein